MNHYKLNTGIGLGGTYAEPRVVAMQRKTNETKDLTEQELAPLRKLIKEQAKERKQLEKEYRLYMRKVNALVQQIEKEWSRL